MSPGPSLPSDLCRRAVTARLPLEHQPSARTALELFRPELDEYAEIISAPPGGSLGAGAGFMTRGEGAGFTERARAVLIGAGADGSAINELSALAAWCEHRRAFFKVEWHPRGDGCDMVMASYFRRRPPLSAVQRHLLDQGVPVEALEQLEELARLLDKRTPHFVSMALRPGFGSHYKIYFSQYVTAETAPAVRVRVRRALEAMEISPAALVSWEAQHDRSLPRLAGAGAEADGGALSRDATREGPLPNESTIFLSVSLTSEGVVPGIKIDYPEVAPEAVAGWAAGGTQGSGDPEAVVRAARAAAAEVGAAALSYVGVRFLPQAAAPVLKFYADRHARPRPGEMRAA